MLVSPHPSLPSSFRNDADVALLRNEKIILEGDIEYFSAEYKRLLNIKDTEPGELEYLREQLCEAKAELFEIQQELKRIRFS